MGRVSLQCKNSPLSLTPSVVTLVADAFSLIKSRKKLPSNCGETAEHRSFQARARTHTQAWMHTPIHRRAQQIAHWHSQTNLFPGDVAPDKSLHPTCLHTLCARYFLQRRLIRFEFHHSFFFASGSIAMVNFVLFYLVSRLAVSVSSDLQARLVLQSTVTIIETKIHTVYAANQCLPKAEIRKKKKQIITVWAIILKHSSTVGTWLEITTYLSSKSLCLEGSFLITA